MNGIPSGDGGSVHIGRDEGTRFSVRQSDNGECRVVLVDCDQPPRASFIRTRFEDYDEMTGVVVEYGCPIRSVAFILYRGELSEASGSHRVVRLTPPDGTNKHFAVFAVDS